jgi:hypothetical protein
MTKTNSAQKEEQQQQQQEHSIIPVAAAVPAFMDEEDFDGGFEGTNKDSFQIPFIQILQKMSPLVDEDNPKYIDGAKSGMFFNTVTQKLIDGKTGFILIPCAYKQSYIQWGARDEGGGFKGEWTPEQVEAMVSSGEVANVDGQLFKPEEDGTVNPKKADYFSDTRSHFILTVDEETGEVGQAILSLAATQRRASKVLMTMLHNKKVDTPTGKRRPPTFANRVRAMTVGMSNDKGSWSGVKFELDGMVTDPIVYAEAKAFYKAIIAGAIKADYSKAAGAETGNTGVSDAPKDAEGF